MYPWVFNGTVHKVNIGLSKWVYNMLYTGRDVIKVPYLYYSGQRLDICRPIQAAPKIA